nr:uncharacterized mitochondrial protein AtMg00810-like [Tanacetum cinerariifolium]
MVMFLLAALAMKILIASIRATEETLTMCYTTPGEPALSHTKPSLDDKHVSGDMDQQNLLLINEDFFLQFAIQECRLNIHLVDGHVFAGGIGDEDSNSLDMCNRYQASPIKKHLEALKQVFRYLRGTINWGLWYPKDTAMALTAYADADHACCQDTRRSTSGSDQFLGDKLVN